MCGRIPTWCLRSRVQKAVTPLLTLGGQNVKSVNHYEYLGKIASIGSHQVQCNILTCEAILRTNVYLFLERCRKTNNIWLRALIQSDGLYSSLSVFPLSWKNWHFFGREPTKILKISACKFGRNFFHRRKFLKTKFHYFCRSVCCIFSQFKPFSDHSMDIQQWAVKKRLDTV